MKVWHRVFALALALLALSFAAPSRAEPGVLVLGRISDDPQRHYDQLKPLLDYVVPRMADVGIREGRILMARDASRMASYLRYGRVDWVTETPAAGLRLIDRAGASVLLLTERDGVARYRSQLFVRAESTIQTLADLRGRTIALQSPQSTSAYLLPAIMLLKADVPLEILPSPSDRPREGSAGYVFADSESNIANWVVKGIVDAGAFSDLDLARWRKERPDAPAVRVVAESPEAPRAMELVRGDLDSAVRERLAAVLLAAAGDPAAADALRHFFGTTGFRTPAADDVADLATLAAAARLTRETIE